MLRNSFARLLDLLPSDPLQVGTVLSASNGTATVLVLGGGVVTVVGDVAEGDRVYFKGGSVQGPAPTLTVVATDI